MLLLTLEHILHCFLFDLWCVPSSLSHGSILSRLGPPGFPVRFRRIVSA
jgi:hypothetical protein